MVGKRKMVRPAVLRLHWSLLDLLFYGYLRLVAALTRSAGASQGGAGARTFFSSSSSSSSLSLKETETLVSSFKPQMSPNYLPNYIRKKPRQVDMEANQNNYGRFPKSENRSPLNG